jgi:glutamate formiminotransferase/formiminotetrahydrofolate cyclodeaminase
MVANLSAAKRGWEDQVGFFSDWATKGQVIKQQLLHMVDEDTRSFNAIMSAFALPKATEEEKQARKLAIQSATLYACKVPFGVMQTAAKALDLIEVMVAKGNPNSVTDAGVGALCIDTCVHGAYLNVVINAKGLDDVHKAQHFIKEGEKILNEVKQRTSQIMIKVREVIG